MEYRHPFMDKEFMSYCLNLPLGMRSKNGFNRYVMREAMKDLIPNEIITRVTKSNVGEYYNYSLRDNFTSMKECIHSAPHCLRQYLDIDRLEQMSFSKSSNLQLISFQQINTLIKWYSANFS